MTTEIRNKYGFPIIAKVESAVQIADDVKERKPSLDMCAGCPKVEQLEGVIRITNNWRKK